MLNNKFLKIKRLTIPSIGEDFKQLELSHIADGSEKSVTTGQENFLHIQIYTFPVIWQFHSLV